MKVPDIFNKIINRKKNEENGKEMANQFREKPIDESEAKSIPDESHNEIHKALDALIDIKDCPKPISLQRERIDAIKSNVMSQNQLPVNPYKKSGGKDEIIAQIKDRIKVGDIKTKQKIKKGYIKHYSNYFSDLKAPQFEIKPRIISKITAYKGNILKNFKEAYKNEHE